MGLVQTIKGYSKLPREIIILLIARIINGLGSFVFPFLAMFLTEKVGMASDRVGRYMTMAAVGGALGSLIGGKLSDYLGRKRVILIFQALAAIMLVPCGFLGNSMVIPWLLILHSFFNGAVHPANSAMVADLTDKKNRQQAFSLLYLGINIGVAIGPSIAGTLYKRYIRWIFWGNALTMFTTLLLIALLVNESKSKTLELNENTVLEDDEKEEKGSIFSVILRRPELLFFSLVSIIYSFVYSQSNFAMPLHMKAIYPEEGAFLFGTLMSVNAIVVVACTVLILHLTRKNKPIFNIALSGLFYAVGFGMLYYVKDYKFFILSTVIWTTGEILSATNQGVYVANHAPSSHRGRVNSILPLTGAAGNALGPYVIGLYIGNKEIKIAWPIIFILSILASMFMYILYLKEQNKEQKLQDKLSNITLN